MIGIVCLSLSLAVAGLGCGDDDDKDDGVNIDTPGADVSVKSLEGQPGAAAAGSAASAPAQR